MKELKYWIALKMVTGVGDVLFRNLISKFQSAEGAFKAELGALQGVEGIGEKTIEAIKNFSQWDQAEKEASRIEKLGFKVILLTDSNYPKNLFTIYNPPPFIYVNGDIIKEDDIAIAVVGTRIPDRYGRLVTEELAGELTAHGITVVSGMARGIDSIAHEGALKRGGRTIAVLGSGLDVIYPQENKKLYERISNQGAIISELPIGAAPDSVNFPKRNRIISGLSFGVVVVQASDKSGSLITASFALDQNREVFAVPANIGSRLSGGTNRLIKQGAKLVESVDDILSEIEAFRNLGQKRHLDESFSSLLSELTPDERAVYSVLKERPLHIDEIIKLTGIDSARALSILLSLELSGIIVQLPAKLFQLKRP